jgi:hypothetical protein
VSDSELGAFVRGRREELGLAQEELAPPNRDHQATLSNLERGTGPGCRRPITVDGCAAALGIGHVDLLVAAGEVAPDELEAWAAGTRPPRRPDWWGAPSSRGCAKSPRTPPAPGWRSRSARLTRREAGFVLLIVDGLPTEAREMRRAGGSAEDYLQWRDSSDALEVLKRDACRRQSPRG